MEMHAMDEALSATLQPLRVETDTLNTKIHLLKEQAKSTIASKGEVGNSQLSELESMRRILEEANDAASQNAAAAVDVLGEQIALRPGTEVESISGSWAKRLVAREMEIFASGGTEMQNFASLAGGASVVEGEPFTSSSMISLDHGWGQYAVKLFGPGKDKPRGSAEEALSTSTSLGHCFAFRGGRGRLTVKLSEPSLSLYPEGDDMAVFVTVTHVTIAHAAVAVTPSVARSAPRHFRVLGWESDPTTSAPRILISDQVFSMDRDAPGIQTFEVSEGDDVQSSPPPVAWVTLEIEGNHGGEWTCLYGFRVHGSRNPHGEGGLPRDGVDDKSGTVKSPRRSSP